jgi:murein DD-endopeptidase MepM/ murein hydrolase activator NlpD
VGLLAFAIGALWATGAGAYALWWLTTTSPPAVVVTVPQGVVRGSINIAAGVEPAGRAAPVEVAVDGRPLPADAQVPLDTATLSDGAHQVSVVAEDRSWRKNRATATATLNTDNTPPQLTVEGQPQRVAQGHTWLLRVRTNEPASVTARFGDRQLPIQAGNGYGWAIVGFSPTADPTTIPVVIDGQDQAGNRSEVSQPLPVDSEQFVKDAVEVPPTLAALLSSDIRSEEDKKLVQNYQQVTQPKLWEGRFTMPVIGEIITEFGSLRSYNGGPYVVSHAGTDIATASGTPVKAPARGKVVVIDKVQLRGNMLTLDHGLGVYTTYAHLSAIDVKVGDTVERGQQIARVGSTGLSTGPHLHWELWVNGANVDPIEWTERDMP